MADKEYGYLRRKSKDTVSVVDGRGLFVADLDREELRELASAMKLIAECEVVSMDKEKIGHITFSKWLRGKSPACRADFRGNEMTLTINTSARLRTFSIDLTWACLVL